MSIVERLIILVLIILALIVGLAAFAVTSVIMVLAVGLFVTAECISYICNGFIWLWNTIFNKNAKYLSCGWFLP